MNKLYYIQTLLFSLCLLLSLASTAQQSPVSESEETSDESSKVKVKNADNFIFERDDDIDIQYLKGNVKMFHDSIFMFSDSAVILGKELTAVGEVIIIQDTTNVFADSLHYNSESKLARLFDNIVLETKDKALFTNRLDYNLDTKIGTFRDTAILRRETMSLSSIRGFYNLSDNRAKFIDQVVIRDEDFNLTADSLDYDTDIDRAYFLGPTYITQEKKQIYCESGYYDLISKQAFFSKDAVIVEGSKVAFAEDILVSEIDSTITFKGNAEVRDSVSLAMGDLIVFNDLADEVEIVGSGFYEKEDKLIEGNYIYYNTETESFKSYGKTSVKGEQGILDADTISYDKTTDFGIAEGSAVWTDTVENRVIVADEMHYRDSSSYVKAFIVDIRPLFFQVVDGDTLYVAADTLHSAEPSDSLTFLKAINDVQIYKSDLQAVCDSMYYGSLDSTFTLFRDPVCWSDTTQFSGDTIDILLKDDQVSEIVAKRKAFIITQHATGYYDQIKGRLLHSYLDSNELDKMKVIGNAESLYFFKDEEDAYVSANKTLCSNMTFYFEEEELDHISVIGEPENIMTPMKMLTPADEKLEGFSWQDNRRPLDVDQLRIKSATVLPVSEHVPQDIFEEDVLKALDMPLDSLDSTLDKSQPIINQPTETGSKLIQKKGSN